MPFSGPIEDRILIRELYGRYSDASSRGNKQDWLACWSEESEWHSHAFHCSGKAAIAKQWDQLWAGFSRLAFFTDVGAIEVSGDRARARSLAREIIQLESGGLIKFAGAYEDELVRVNSEWLFARRDYRVLIGEPPDLTRAGTRS